MKKSLAFCILWMIGIHAFAQRPYYVGGAGNLSAHFGLGFCSYLGDLKQSNGLEGKPGISLGARYTLSNHVSLRSEIQWYTMRAADSTSQDKSFIQRNLSFRSGSLELNMVGLVHLFPESGRSPVRRGTSRPFNAYAFIGLGLTTVNPKGELSGVRHNLRKLQTEGTSYGAFALVIPVGVGASYKVNEDFAVSLELGYRLTFTDYLDDVSTAYVDPASFSDPIAVALADRGPEIGATPKEEGDQRGNPGSDDAYYIISLKLEYINLYKLFGGGNPYNLGKKPKMKRF